jgi:alkyl hydroperoxide reductase subunit AhpF
MIGADPSTEWLDDAVGLDDRRFVLTHAAASNAATGSQFATSLPGVFAVGDVRSNSVKRVASAVGEGAQAIAAVHSFLASVGHRVGAHRHAVPIAKIESGTCSLPLTIPGSRNAPRQG